VTALTNTAFAVIISPKELIILATIKQIEEFLDARIPRSLSVPSDPDGTALCMGYDVEVTKVVTALDVTVDAIEFAKEKGAQLIISHHPSIYAPLTSITEKDAVGKRILAAVKAGVSLMSYHTRLDAVEGGVNDRLCELLGIKDTEAFDIGLGRVGVLEKDYGFEEFCAKVKEALGTEKVTGISCGKSVRRVAVLGGSGKGSFNDAVATGADTYLTGEVIHSTLLDAREQGINLICATHYRTESPVISVIGKFLKEAFADIEIFEYYDNQL